MLHAKRKKKNEDPHNRRSNMKGETEPKIKDQSVINPQIKSQ